MSRRLLCLFNSRGPLGCYFCTATLPGSSLKHLPWHT